MRYHIHGAQAITYLTSPTSCVRGPIIIGRNAECVSREHYRESLPNPKQSGRINSPLLLPRILVGQHPFLVSVSYWSILLRTPGWHARLSAGKEQLLSLTFQSGGAHLLGGGDAAPDCGPGSSCCVNSRLLG